MGMKKRLRRIEVMVRNLPPEKWLIDRIVALSAEQVELRMRGLLRETVERTVRQVGEEMDRRMPDPKEVERMVEDVVRRVFDEREQRLRDEKK